MLCPMVGEVSDEGADGEQPERLKIAMSLYAADVIEEDCLDTEADFALWHRQDKHNAYLAKALAHSADEKMFQNYSQKTCEENEKSDECRLLDLLASQGHREGESSLLKSQELKASNFLMAQVNLNSPEYLQIWLIKYFAKQREFNKVLQLLENVPPQKGLSQFFANQRTKALWSLDRINEARVASRMTIESASPSQRIEIASWVCQRELRDGCTVSVAQSCHELQAAVATNNELLKTPEVALSFINEELCRSSGMVSSDVKEKLSDPRALQFVSGLEEAGKRTAKPKLEEFKKMSAKGAETDAFFYESQRILVDAAESVKDVQSLLDYWLKDTPSDDWVTVGLHLNARLTAWGGYEKALAVAQKLQAFEVSSPSMSRLLVVSAFHAGQTELAAKTLSALPQDRAPASVDEFEKIAT